MKCILSTIKTEFTYTRGIIHFNEEGSERKICGQGDDLKINATCFITKLEEKMKNLLAYIVLQDLSEEFKLKK